ncbi:hypothetical protein MSG28_015515 [Choristoneura fumiferana]|uniref:Uncharacterized protein n=1 Tax=Choristoneura fumiferana TaxID=7141 RepID=A0ACC0KAZ5_CHOFU|nr:hypothetical protein MSG28_015515 [Choristoneura fumiferana]
MSQPEINYKYSVGCIFLPFVWAVNAVWFFKEAFMKPPFDEQKQIKKYLNPLGTCPTADDARKRASRASEEVGEQREASVVLSLAVSECSRATGDYSLHSTRSCGAAAKLTSLSECLFQFPVFYTFSLHSIPDVVMSGAGALAWAVVLISWALMFQSRRVAWGATGEALSFVLPLGRA